MTLPSAEEPARLPRQGWLWQGVLSRSAIRKATEAYMGENYDAMLDHRLGSLRKDNLTMRGQRR